MHLVSNSSPIGVFDSGIGGLTVVKRISALLPNEDIIYFGDTARVPYGSKSNSTVIEYSKQDAAFLSGHNVKLIIVACNTASAVAIQKLKDTFDLPVIGMIEPGANMALRSTTNNRIGVIGTNATVTNKAYSTKLKTINPSVEVFEKACPLFVPLAEEGWVDHKATYLIAEEYLNELRRLNIDTLILGCTHYPILSSVIQDVIGEGVKMIDSGTAAAETVKEYLAGAGLLSNSDVPGRHDFYVSDVPSKFKEIAKRFLGEPINHIEKIEVDNIKIT